MTKLPISSLAFASFLVMAAPPLHAQQVGTYDAGVSCAKYVVDFEHRNDPKSIGYRQDMVYADGYLSGMNMANYFNPDHVSTMIGGQSSVASRGLSFYEYCRKHPQKAYVYAIQAFIHGYWERVPYPR